MKGRVRISLAGRIGASLLVVVIGSGCTASRQRPAGEPLAHRGADDRNGEPPVQSGEGLEAFIARVRQLSAVARPPRTGDAGTIEQQDAELTDARLLLTVAPTADHHRRVAEAYARLGVLDAAYDHFTAAARLDPRDAGSHDGLARVWRDWGFPHLGLVDAYRAIYYAPSSPIPQNTLGTLLLKLGQPANARRAFEQAIALDGRAAFAYNNLCYARTLEGDATGAIDACRHAVALAPELKAAHNNLALAYAAAGDLTAAAAEFASAGSIGAGRYNMGVALLATRHFDAAALAFDDASAQLGTPAMALARARQARRLAAADVPEVP